VLDFCFWFLYPQYLVQGKVLIQGFNALQTPCKNLLVCSLSLLRIQIGFLCVFILKTLNHIYWVIVKAICEKRLAIGFGFMWKIITTCILLLALWNREYPLCIGFILGNLVANLALPSIIFNLNSKIMDQRDVP
jgi:hypothetical protein